MITEHVCILISKVISGLCVLFIRPLAVASV